jgi:hypothetical protein
MEMAGGDEGGARAYDKGFNQVKRAGAVAQKNGDLVGAGIGDR